MSEIESVTNIPQIGATGSGRRGMNPSANLRGIRANGDEGYVFTYSARGLCYGESVVVKTGVVRITYSSKTPMEFEGIVVAVGRNKRLALITLPDLDKITWNE
jgi:hypothetical protein